MLLNPWIYDFSAYNLWIKPLGLYYLATYLRKNGHKVSLIDCLEMDSSNANSAKAFPKTKMFGEGKFYAEEIAKPKCLEGVPKKYKRYGLPLCLLEKKLQCIEEPDFIFITSMMTYWYPGVWDAIKVLKNFFPQSTIVLGGIYATLCYEHSQNSGADIVVAGAVEDSFRYIQENILECPVKYLPNKEEPDNLPYPAFELASRTDYVPILAGRGCPFRCSYCASQILNSQFFRRTPTKVLDEIEFYLEKFGTRNFVFYDDALLYDSKGFFLPFAKMVLQRKMAINFHSPNGLHLSEINSDVAEMLFAAGFKTIRFGLETSNPQRQKESGGKVVNEQFVTAMKMLHEAGYTQEDIGVYILCGLPEQGVKEVEETIAFVQKNRAKAILAEFSPIPHTRLWKEALSHSEYDLAKEPLFQNNTLLPCASTEMRESLQRLKTISRQTPE